MTAIKTFQSVIERLESENASLRIERDAIKSYAADKIDRLTAERDALKDDLKFCERMANHHGAKATMTAVEALSCIQHYPGITAITKSYADGKIPDTPNPYAARDTLLIKANEHRDGRLRNAEEAATLRIERDTLRTFAQYVIDWTDNDMDCSEVQDKAVELGLLKLTEPAPTGPCDDFNCACREYYSTDEWLNGEVVCYRRTALLMGENV